MTRFIKNAQKILIGNRKRGYTLPTNNKLYPAQWNWDSAFIALGYSYFNLNFALIYGGTSYKAQLQKIRSNVDIIIGTPGRIIDFYKQKAFTLDNIQVSVLDEADRMFDLGFIKDIRFLLRRMPAPESRLNLLFSATLSYKVTELAYEHMNNPVLVRINEEQVTSKAIKQSAFCPSNEQKIPLLIGALTFRQPKRAIIFVNTKRCAEMLYDYLKINEFDSAVLSGDVAQDKREKLLKKFQDNQLSMLIATDVAARGLDIPLIEHVINYDIPQNPEDYIHRIGRTARAGAKGSALTFLTPADQKNWYLIEKLLNPNGTKIPIAF